MRNRGLSNGFGWNLIQAEALPRGNLYNAVEDLEGNIKVQFLYNPQFLGREGHSSMSWKHGPRHISASDIDTLVGNFTYNRWAGRKDPRGEQQCQIEPWLQDPLGLILEWEQQRLSHMLKFPFITSGSLKSGMRHLLIQGLKTDGFWFIFRWSYSGISPNYRWDKEPKWASSGCLLSRVWP
jgi:hypothetical protein